MCKTEYGGCLLGGDVCVCSLCDAVVCVCVFVCECICVCVYLYDKHRISGGELPRNHHNPGTQSRDTSTPSQAATSTVLLTVMYSFGHLIFPFWAFQWLTRHAVYMSFVKSVCLYSMQVEAIVALALLQFHIVDIVDTVDMAAKDSHYL